MNILLLKCIVIPLLTGLVSWVQRRSTHLGGLLSALPLTGGPITVFLAIEQGREFAHQVAITTCGAYLAPVLFVVAFLSAAHRLSWKGCLAVGLATWAGTIFVLGLIKPTPYTAVVLGSISVFICFLYVRNRKPTPCITVQHMPHELAIRSAVTLVPLLLITGIAHIIGPEQSGLLAAFPTMWSVVFSFSLARGGRDSAVAFFRGSVFGQFGFLAFYFLLIFVSLQNLWLWFGLACVGAIAISSLAHKFQRYLMPEQVLTDKLPERS